MCTGQDKRVLMVWGAISYIGQKVLVPVQGIINGSVYADILREHLPGSISGSIHNTFQVFQQDNVALIGPNGLPRFWLI